MVRIDLGSIVLTAGSNATLAFQYTGRFNPQQQGIYRSAPYMFTDPAVGREASVLLVTQLESTGARHVFPCYDEPSYKVSLLHEHTFYKLSPHAACGAWRTRALSMWFLL